CDAANPRIETLGDALDNSPFASRITTFEDDHDLETLTDDPILQLHQLALQLEQLAKVEGTIDAVGLGPLDKLFAHFVESSIIDLHFEFFIEAVDQFFANPAVQILSAFTAGHLGNLRHKTTAKE